MSAMPAAAEQSLLSRTDFQVISWASTFGRTAAMMSLKVPTLELPCVCGKGGVPLTNLSRSHAAPE